MTLADLHIIQGIFDHPLPGKDGHAPLAKNLGRVNITVPEDARLAAVMILLFPNEEGQLEVVFTERTVTNNGDSHSGQMSFPGGKKDPTDENLEYTALRETWEEIGVEISSIHVIGNISQLYIPVSNFLVNPYVGYLNHKPTFIKEEREVAEIISAPLSQLLKDCIEPLATDIKIRDGLILKDVPYFDIKGKVLWGATSMMLNEFLVAIRKRLS